MQRSKTLLALTLWLTPAVAAAQLDVRLHVPLPTIRFEVAPPLVVVSEGVQVVPDRSDEVFFTDGWYWYREDRHWYRTRDHRGGWVLVDRRYVPGPLAGIPPGKYRHHRGRGNRKMRYHEADGRVTEVKIKEKRGYTEVKVKEKKGKGKWK